VLRHRPGSLFRRPPEPPQGGEPGDLSHLAA
jgi:hypothetical protein